MGLEIGKKGSQRRSGRREPRTLQQIASTDAGKNQLLIWYNSILHTGALPPRWHDLVLLPKCDKPCAPKGIALDCAADQIFSRIVLRCKPLLPFHECWQCAAPHRQSSDLIFTLHRLTELDREWGAEFLPLRQTLRLPSTTSTVTSSLNNFSVV